MSRKLLPASKRYNRQATRHYNTGSKVWRAIREQVLVRDLYTCKHCKTLVIRKGEAHVDHIDNNTANNKLENLQTLCIQCHGRKTQREMFGGPMKGGDVDGMPADPDHPWNAD